MNRALALALVVLALALVACGGEGDVQVSPSSPPTPAGIVPLFIPPNAPTLEADAVLGPDERQAWVAVDPDTGSFRRLPPIDGFVPGRLSGDRYALVSTASGMAVLDSAERRSTPIGAGWDGEVSPDGRWAAVIPETEGPTLAVVDVQSGARFDLGALGKAVQLSLSWDGRLAIVRDGTLYLAEQPDWKPRSVGAFPYARPVWSRDGRLAFAADGGIRLASADLSHIEAVALAGSLQVAMAWSADGRLALGGADGAYLLLMANDRSWTVVNISPVGAGEGSNAVPFWSPSGSEIAFSAFDRTLQINGIVVAKADGSGARQITSGHAQVIGWSGDGILARVERGPQVPPPPR